MEEDNGDVTKGDGLSDIHGSENSLAVPPDGDFQETRPIKPSASATSTASYFDEKIPIPQDAQVYALLYFQSSQKTLWFKSPSGFHTNFYKPESVY